MMLTKLITILIFIIPLIVSAPNMMLKHSINCFNSSSFPNNQCTHMKQTKNYISRLGNNSILQIYQKLSFNRTGLLDQFNTNIVNKLYDYHIQHAENLTLISTSQGTFLYSLMDFSQLAQINFLNSSRSIYKESYLGSPMSSYLITESFQYNLSKNPAFETNNAFNPFANLQDYKFQISPNQQIIVFWDHFSNIIIYSYVNNHIVPSETDRMTLNNNNVRDTTDSISFSQDSTSFIVEMDGLYPLKIVNLYPNGSISNISSFSFNGTIKKALFVDNKSQYIMIASNNQVVYFQVSTLSQIGSQQIGFNSSFFQIDYIRSQMYVCQNNSIDIYDIDLTCPQFCLNCQHFECIQCMTGYKKNGDQCVLVQQKQSHTYTYIIMPDGSKQKLQLTQQQKQIIDNTKHGINFSNKVLEEIFLFLSSFPFIYMFLSNLNFFTICSFYAYTNIIVPNDIYQMLKSVQKSLNYNILTFFNFRLDLSYFGQQKITNPKHLQLGLSTLFLQTNYQQLIMGVFIFMIMIAFRVCSRFVKKQGILYKILHHRTSDVVFGLILSNIAQIILPYQSLIGNISFKNVFEKTNVFLYVINIGFLLIFLGFLVAFLGVQKIKKNKKSNQKSRNNHTIMTQKQTDLKIKHGLQNIKQQRQNIYFGFNNLLFALLVTVNNPIFFLLIGQLFIFIGIYKAFSYKKWKLNKTILSIYPILFHICFIIFHFSDNLNLTIGTMIACLLIYLIGSLHQFITMFAEMLSFIYPYLRSFISKNNKVNSIKDENHKEAGSIQKKVSCKKEANYQEASYIQRTRKQTKNIQRFSKIDPLNKTIYQIKNEAQLQSFKNTVKQGCSFKRIQKPHFYLQIKKIDQKEEQVVDVENIIINNEKFNQNMKNKNILQDRIEVKQS